MNVVDRSGTTVEFSRVPVASCFEFENSLFMRIVKEDKMPYNVIALADGVLYEMASYALVTPVEADIVIRGKGVYE